jgi:hypothetical protein
MISGDEYKLWRYLSGVYKQKYNGCEKVCVGQTGRNFNTRFLEHIHDIRNNKDNSKYAQHILDHQCEYGKKEKNMEIVKIINKDTQRWN